MILTLTLIVFPLISYLNLDRWALLKLYNLVETGQEEPMKILIFAKSFHELDYFCAVDMSAVYLDILKDRLYTFRADSALRRGSQTVLFDIVVALAKLMAPMLSFTAEEIWRTLASTGSRESLGASRSIKASVHLSAVPGGSTPMAGCSQLAQRWEQLLEVRVAVQAALERSTS